MILSIRNDCVAVALIVALLVLQPCWRFSPVYAFQQTALHRTPSRGRTNDDFTGSGLMRSTALSSSQPYNNDFSDSNPPSISKAFENRRIVKVPSWVDLPKTVERESTLPKAEIVFGRIAMISAIVLFAGEIFTGHSIVEQVMLAMNMIE